MENQIRAIIARGTQPQRHRTSVAQFIRAEGGRKIALIGADSRPTAAGLFYYKELGIEPPKRFAYEQPLLNDKWVVAFDGSRVKVRERMADGSWRITKAGMPYFKYNRTEFLPSIPYLVAKNLLSDGNGGYDGTVALDSRDAHMSKIFQPRDFQDVGLPDPATVGRVRAMRVGRLPLHASDAEQLAEAREAVLAQLRALDRVRINGTEYVLLGIASDVWHVWDESRPLKVDQQRTNFWDDRPPTTETILGRPLRDWALPDGAWRPFDLHPDTFESFQHGCAVQMIHRCFSKSLSGSQKKQGLTERTPRMTIEQISYELDRCFEELGYKDDQYPFEHGWRTDGVPASMVVQFCQRQAAREWPLKCFIFHRGRKILEYAPENATKDTPIVTMAIWGHHAYFYQRGKANDVASHTSATTDSKPYNEFSSRRVRDLYPRIRTPLYATWREDSEFSAHLVKGFKDLASKKRKSTDEDGQVCVVFKADTLDDMEKSLESIREIQDRFKGTERCFTVKPNYGAKADQIKSVSIVANGCPPIKFCSVGKHCEVLNRLTDQIQKTAGFDPPFQYRGESMAAFGENLRLAVSKHRRCISQPIKDKVLKRQHGCCAICRESLEKTEYDHKTPLADGGGHALENVQALCPPCHAEKSRGERLTSFGNAGYSELSQDVMEALLDAPKPQQLVFGNGIENCIELDVVKCRRYAIEKADYLPVGCVLDDIVPYVEGDPVDFVYIDAGSADTDDYANFVAYQGPQWMTWELAQWILDTGVRALSGPITTEHFIATWSASSHIESYRIRALYADIEGALTEAMEGYDVHMCPSWPDTAPETLKAMEDSKDNFRKGVILAMQGSWLTQHSYSWKVCESPCMDDAPAQVKQFEDLHDHHGTMRWKCQSETLTNRTMYLWGLHSLNTEHLLVAKAIALTKKIPSIKICGVVVDAVLFQASTTRKEELEKLVNNTRRNDDSEIFKLKNSKRTPNNPPSTSTVNCMASAWGRCDDEREGFNRFKPSSLGNWLEYAGFLYDRQWRVMDEPGGLGRGSADTFQLEAAQAIFENRGGLVAGRGGTGKSSKEYGVLPLTKALFEKAGYTVDVIAFTHVQASNVTGETILHHLHSKIHGKQHVIIIDESSQVPLRLWAALATMKFTGSHFVVLGDVAGQLPPIADQHREELWSGVDRSDFMHQLVGGLRVELNKFRRGGDQAHFDFVGSIYPQHTCLGDALQLARERYPIRRSDLAADTTLCVTNRCRLAINRRVNNHLAPADAILVKYDGKDESAQDMKLWVGVVLQAATTDRKHLKNALRYKVIIVTKETTELVQCDDRGEAVGKPFSLPTADVPASLRLCHAITYDSSQARTLYGNVRLTQTSHSRMNLRRLIVGLGRAPEGAQIEVE